MLSHEDNETLVRVGPHTAMGNLFRLYWIPFYLSKDLTADGQPKRVRLLGEDLVVFRDTSGKPGLIDIECAHRGAPMMFARNEENGLRCVYHGWKFDVGGNLLDTPAEPENSRLKGHVTIKSYPCRERNGVIWTYMGPEGEVPPLPMMEWNLVADHQVHVSLRIQECNWLQSMEGEIDSAHASILHSRTDGEGRAKHILVVQDSRPVFECVRQEFGVSIAARRSIGGGAYWRVTQFVMPFYTLVPPQSKFPELTGHAWVPMDDEHTICVTFSYHPNDKLNEKTRQLFEEGYHGREAGHPSRHGYRNDRPNDPYAGFWSSYNRDNQFQFDYQGQLKSWFSGIPGLWVQDAAVQSGYSPIFDRTREKLGVSDSGIVAARRALLDCAKNYADKRLVPANVGQPDLSMVRALSLHLAPDEPWQESGRQHMAARLGEGFGYTP